MIGGGFGVDGPGLFGFGVEDVGSSGSTIAFDFASDGASAVSEAVAVDHGFSFVSDGSSLVVLSDIGRTYIVLASDGVSLVTLDGDTHTFIDFSFAADGASTVSLTDHVSVPMSFAAAGASNDVLAIVRIRHIPIVADGASAAALEFSNTIGPKHSKLRLAWDPPMTRLTKDLLPGDDTMEILTDDGFLLDPPFEVVLGQEVRRVTGKISTLIWSLDIAPTRGTVSEPHFAGGPLAATVTGLPHTITIRKGGESWDLTTIALPAFTTHETTPNGEVEAKLEYWTMHPETMLVPMDARVLIGDLDGSYFSGLTSMPEVDRRGDGACHISVTVIGYIAAANWDGYEDVRDWPAFTPGHQIVTESRDEKCQSLISSSNAFIVHGGQSLTQETHGISKSPKGLWDLVCSMGDLGGILDYHVRTDDGGSANLHLIKREAGTVVRAPMSSFESTGVKWDSNRLRNKIVVRWRDGVVIAGGTATPVRWLYKDYSSSIDNIDLAKQVADQLLAVTTLQDAIGSKGLVLEYPKPIYENDGVTPFPHWRIRSGWRLILTDLSSWRMDLPIGIFPIVDVVRDHGKHKITLELGQISDENLDITAQYTARGTTTLGHPASGIIPSFVTPPEGTGVGVSSDLVSWGAAGADGKKGKLGWDNIAKDAAVEFIWYGLDGGGDPITPGRKLEIPIEFGMQILGLRLMCNDGTGTEAADPGPASIDVLLKHDIRSNYPAAGSLVGEISVSADFVADPIDFLDDGTSAAGHTLTLAPTSVPGLAPYLTVTVREGATAVFASFGLMIRRTSGSTRGVSTDPPEVSASATVNGDGSTTFTVTTNKLCTCQIDYGPDANYRSKTLPSNEPQLVSKLTRRGIPAGYHYQVHATTVDLVTVSTGDLTV